MLKAILSKQGLRLGKQDFAILFIITLILIIGNIPQV